MLFFLFQSSNKNVYWCRITNNSRMCLFGRVAVGNLKTAIFMPRQFFFNKTTFGIIIKRRKVLFFMQYLFAVSLFILCSMYLFFDLPARYHSDSLNGRALAWHTRVSRFESQSGHFPSVGKNFIRATPTMNMINRVEKKNFSSLNYEMTNIGKNGRNLKKLFNRLFIDN